MKTFEAGGPTAKVDSARRSLCLSVDEADVLREMNVFIAGLKETFRNFRRNTLRSRRIF